MMLVKEIDNESATYANAIRTFVILIILDYKRSRQSRQVVVEIQSALHKEVLRVNRMVVV